MDAVQIVERLGLPVGLLLALGFAIWKTMRVLGPLVVEFFKRQIQFTEVVERNTTETAHAMTEVHRGVEEFSREIRGLKSVVQENNSLTAQLIEESRRGREDK